MQQTPPDVLAWLASQVGLDAHLAKQKSAPALPPAARVLHCAATSGLHPRSFSRQAAARDEPDGLHSGDARERGWAFGPRVA